MKIYVCADDYGMTPQTCTRIEQCRQHGILNKISVFPNSELPELEQRVLQQDAYRSIHLNLVEGKSLSDPKEVPLLVAENGHFRHSFIGLLLLSLSPKKKEFQRQVAREIRAQLLRGRTMTVGDDPKAAVSIDSHQHTHMIPAIFRILLQVIREEKMQAAYLRIPSEPILPYLCTPSLYGTYRIANLIKQWLLRFFARVNRREWKASGIPSACFMGILFSGCMDEKRVRKVLPHYRRYAEKRNMDIELLFHPGYWEPGEALFDENKTGFRQFHCSEGRKLEFDALMHLTI